MRLGRLWGMSLLCLGLLLARAQAAPESYTRPFQVLPAEVVYLYGAVNLMNAPGYEVNAILGDQLNDGEVLLLGPGAKATLRLKDGTRITIKGAARLLLRPLPGPSAQEAAEIIMTRGRFLVQRAPGHGPRPYYRLVSACGVVVDGGQSFEVQSQQTGCLYDGLDLTGGVDTAVVGVFSGYGHAPWRGRHRGWVFERDPLWHTGPAGP